MKAANRPALITGDQIKNIAVRASSSDDSAACANLVSGEGISDSDGDRLKERSTDASQMWLSEKGQTSGWLEFDLGQACKLDQMFVWNYNAKNRTVRGVKQADISVWTEQSGWQKVLDDYPFAEGEGAADYDEPVQVKLEGIEAQKVKFDELVNFGDLQYVGLSQVQFFAPLIAPAQDAEAVVDISTDEETSGEKRNWIWVLSIFAAAAVLVFLVTRKQKQATG